MTDQEPQPLTFEEEVDALATAGLLTRRQAEAFVHRKIEGTPRAAAAEDMGISVSTLDDYVADAQQKLRAAGETIRALESVRFQAGDPPYDSPHYDRYLVEYSYTVSDTEE